MRVPSYDGLNVGASTLPQVSFRPAVIDGSGANKAAKLQEFKAVTVDDIAGKQLQKTGDALQRAGNNLASIQIEAEKEVAQVRIDDALNRAKEATLKYTYDRDVGYSNIKGDAALTRESGRSLEDEYTEKLTKDFQAIGEGLGTEMQKRLFAQKASEIATNFRAGLSRHTAEQYTNYKASVIEGTQKTAINEIAAKYDNPKAIEEAIQTIKRQTYEQAKLLGKSAEWQEAHSRDMTSSAIKVAISAAINSGDLSLANGYLTKFKDNIEAQDVIPLQKVIKEASDTNMGLSRADYHLRDVKASIDPTDFDRVIGITIQTESAGNPNAVSQKGAKGLMQVMDATNKNPGFGIKPAKDDSPEERVRVGKEFMGAMIKRYGTLDKAWAAYNAGPGAVDKAMKKAEQSADQFRGVGPSDYLAYLPKETQDYVAKNVSAYESGGGKAKTKTIDEIDAQLRADPYLASHPIAYKAARERVEKSLSDLSKAKKIREDEALNTALDAVEKNGGSYASLPPELKNAVPPDRRDTVMTHAERIAKGVKVETNLTLYNKWTNNPEQLQSLSDAEFMKYRTELSVEDFKHFSNLRKKTPSNSADSLDTGSINQGLNVRLSQIGIDPTPKDGTPDAQRSGAIKKFVNDYFIAKQAEVGKKLTDKEVSEHLDALFAKNVQFRNTVLGFSTGTESRQLLGMKISDIPDSEIDAIKKKFAESGITTPTDGQILSVYFMKKTAKK